MDNFSNTNENNSVPFEADESITGKSASQKAAEETILENTTEENAEIHPAEGITEVTTPTNDEPIYNPVSLDTIMPMSDYKPMSRGLKVFALTLALIMLLTGTCVAGYYAGKYGVSVKAPTVKVELAPAPEDGKELTAANVYNEVNPSIVGITVYNSSGNISQASGIVYSKNGYIITNDHIYSEVANPKFKIYTHDGKEYSAKYIAGDLVSDLAVLKLTDGELKPAIFGNSDDLYMGQRVVAIGRPNDATDTSSITSGIISALNRRVSNSSNYPARLIQTDSPINPGSSGGALVNMYGQVVGVTSSKLASVEYEGMGYAIPTTVMKLIAEELISNGKVVSRAKLGITYSAVDSVSAEINGLENTGLLIQSVLSDSDLYGKVAKGDIITQINGTSISSDDMVLDIIEGCRAGDTISVTVITENGRTKELKVKLSANVGQSSYTTKESQNPLQEGTQGGIFDFPEGE